MAKRSFTEPKPRDDTGFNPFKETLKVIGFAEQAGHTGHDFFTVFVKDGNLEWTFGPFNKKYPGFVARIDRQKFLDGTTSSAWRKLEEQIAKEMCEQRKAW